MDKILTTIDLISAFCRNTGTNTHYLPLSGWRENLLTFSRYLYTGSTVHLDRKKIIFDQMEEYHKQHTRDYKTTAREQRCKTS